MANEISLESCANCQAEWEPGAKQCRQCGSTRKEVKKSILFGIGVKSLASAEKVEVYYQFKKLKLTELVGNIIIDIFLIFIGSVMGLLINGWIGAMVGFVICVVFALGINLTLRRYVKELNRKITKF